VGSVRQHFVGCGFDAMKREKCDGHHTTGESRVNRHDRDERRAYLVRRIPASR